MRYLRSIASFWYDFVVGDDWRVAVAVVAAIGGTALLAHAGVPAWWLIPVIAVAALAGSLVSAVRRKPNQGSP